MYSSSAGQEGHVREVYPGYVRGESTRTTVRDPYSSWWYTGIPAPLPGVIPASLLLFPGPEAPRPSSLFPGPEAPRSSSLPWVKPPKTV